MNSLRLSIVLLGLGLFISGCGDDDMGGSDITACQLIEVLTKLDETTSLGIIDIAYDDNGRIESAGLQTYEFTYDADGNITEALLPETSLNPQVRFVFSYNGNQISEIREIWGVDTNEEERHVFSVTYGSNGFVNGMTCTGFACTQQLIYSFDSNGNPLHWTEPAFGDIRSFTFDTSQKGLFENLDHNVAFACGIAVGQPFFHFRNAVTSENTTDQNGQVEEDNMFTNLEFNALKLQTIAGDPDGTEYIFEYKCE